MSLVGKVFTRLTVLSLDINKSTKHAKRYLCKCECGEIRSVVTAKLNNGTTKSCGCLRAERISKGQNLKHGLRKSRTYAAWANMKTRCDNHETKSFKDYGERGIRYDSRWVEFEEFLSDMGVCPDQLTLERVDVNGNYEKSNCIWDTNSVQVHNRRKLPMRSADTYSKYIGVSWNLLKMKWVTVLRREGKTLLRKSFNSEVCAARAYDDASEIHYGNRPNQTERL